MPVQRGKWQKADVADRQQDFYSQLIHIFGGAPSGQHVGDLWISGGLWLTFPHGGFGPDRYAQNGLCDPSILSKIVANAF